MNTYASLFRASSELGLLQTTLGLFLIEKNSLHIIYLLEPIDYVGVLSWLIRMCALLNSCIVYLLSIYIKELESNKIVKILTPVSYGYTIGAKVLYH